MPQVRQPTTVDDVTRVQRADRQTRRLRGEGFIERLVHRVAPWALSGMLFVGTWVTPHRPPFEHGNLAGVSEWALLGQSLASVVAVAMIRRRRWPLYLVTLIGWLSISQWLNVIVAVYYATTTIPRRRRVVWFGLAAALLVAGPYIVGALAAAEGTAGSFLSGGFITAVLVGLPFTVGMWVNSRRQVLSGLRERADRLERERVVQAERAKIQERTRIAREMHDVVAHRVALMVLHAGALEVNTTDSRTAEAASLIRTTGREALSDLRQVLGVLRTPETASGTPETASGTPEAIADLVPQPTLADLESLVGRSRAAGLPVEILPDRTEPDLADGRDPPMTVQRTAYRVIQEALTNVVKHAGAVPTTVELRYGPDRLEVSVINEAPTGPPPGLPGSGLGLIGMRERVALSGGTVEAAAGAGGGFVVRASIPVTWQEGVPG
ncbi:MAG: histidine kinase [Dactylosporangium sp.]|nr:hypothetical protein [Dactylosporangium sp.]NNJ59746.1 histidine kinase [Dactylosporangium sp.]